MANLSETVSYDAGVYQLETTDPVSGGPSGIANAPLKNLANRTAWLKQHMDSVENSNALKANILSPTLTGDPSAPTPPLGDNDTSIATSEFVQGTIGFFSKSVAGSSNITLTAVEAGHGILRFYGALTASISVSLPISPTRSWIVINDTTGAHFLTIKTPAGSGVYVDQGFRKGVYTDGIDIKVSQTDFTDAWLSGSPTAPTQAYGDNSNKLATTAFVTAAAGIVGVTSVAGRTGVVTLAVADVVGAAPTLSPALTGTPTAPTATPGDNTTKLATTAFVQDATNSGGAGAAALYFMGLLN